MADPMKLHETCTCGAEIEVEHDDPESVRNDVAAWRTGHRCLGPQPWRRSVQSTTGTWSDFGFQQREDTVMARG